MARHNDMYIISSHTKKIFANMRRIRVEAIKPKRKQRKEAETSHDESEDEDHIPTPSSDPLPSGKEKRAGKELIQEITKKQKVEDDKETTELKQFMEIIPDEEEVEIDAIPLFVKSLKIVNWKIYKKGRKSYYQIVRADVESQMYMVFSQMLKSFEREDLTDL
nr:hypothetical protein [Tanacetum cinerariifolium]